MKIADFGVARVNLSDSPITRVGTNIYAPPEHSPLNFDENGHMTVATLTPAADVYSLAKSVYTLITGEAPRAFANKQISELPLTWRDREWSADLLRVLNRATSPDPSSRHRCIDDFWQDLEPVRKIAFDMETFTAVRPKLHAAPQPHVSRGYSPLAPQQPRFDTSRELKLPNVERGMRNADPLIVDRGLRKPPIAEPPIADLGLRNADPLIADRGLRNVDFVGNGAEVDPRAEGSLPEEIQNPKSKIQNRARRWAIFAALLVVFAGGLYGTSMFLRSRGILPPISNPFAYKTGRANTDINLRPEPNANNDPIGLVTKNSRVRILRTQNNWYEVQVLEQGRERDAQLATNRGWLNGKYVDLDQR